MQTNSQIALKAEGRAIAPVAGLAGWLLNKLRRGTRGEPRLSLVERITLAPRQSVALIEAEGRRFLVATSQDGAPAFYPLDETGSPGKRRKAQSARQAGSCSRERIS